MELDLKKTVSILVAKLWIIVVAALSSGVLFFIVNAFFVTPMYTSQAILYVSNVSERKSSIVTTSDVSVSKELVNTCIVILNSRTVLDKVAEQSGLDYSASQIKSMISANAVSSTEIFQINVTHKDPVEAQIIADAILKVAPGEIKRVMNAGAVSVIDYATLPLSPSSPNIPKNTVMGILFGGFLAALVIVVIYVFDTRIKSEFELVENFDLPIIGIIPAFGVAEVKAGKKKKKLFGRVG